MKTLNSVKTGRDIAYIATNVVYGMPAVGTVEIHVPLSNFTDEVNFEISDASGVVIIDNVFTNNGNKLTLDVSSANVGTYNLVVISPGGYTNENLNDDLINNHVGRIVIDNTLPGLVITGEDGDIDVFKLLTTKFYIEKGAEEEVPDGTPKTVWQVDQLIPYNGSYKIDFRCSAKAAALSIDMRVDLIMVTLDGDGNEIGGTEVNLFDNSRSPVATGLYETHGGMFRRKTLVGGTTYRFKTIVTRLNGAASCFTKEHRLWIELLP